MGLFMPQAAMVKQLLMAAGFTDATVLKMVDKVMGGTFKNPQLVPFTADSFHIAPGSETVMVQADNGSEGLTLLLVCRRKAEIVVDGKTTP